MGDVIKTSVSTHLRHLDLLRRFKNTIKTIVFMSISLLGVGMLLPQPGSPGWVPDLTDEQIEKANSAVKKLSSEGAVASDLAQGLGVDKIESLINEGGDGGRWAEEFLKPGGQGQ